MNALVSFPAHDVEREARLDALIREILDEWIANPNAEGWARSDYLRLWLTHPPVLTIRIRWGKS